MGKNGISDAEFRARLLKPLDKIHNEAATAADQIYQEPEKVKSDKDPNTLNKYVSNPTGKGSGYVANRAMIKNGLNLTFIKLLREHRKAFIAMPYVYGNGDILYWVKVPSEFYSDNKITYDVLFLLKYDKNRERKNREMTVYSNSPSFIFTYCYVYNKHGLIIPKLKSKLPREALTMPPEVRNPIQSFGFEKSTYIAARYLLDGKCLSDEYINRFSKPLNELSEKTVFNKIADPEVLLSIYQHAQYEKRKTHKKEISAEQKAKREEQKKNYVETQKKITPRSGFIVQRSPRAKITARKAQRSLMNDKKK